MNNLVWRKVSYFKVEKSLGLKRAITKTDKGTPYDPSVKLFQNTGYGVRQSEYVSIIGNLWYVVDCTSLEIAMPWDSYSSLQIGHARSFFMLLKESWNVLKGPWI